MWRMAGPLNVANSYVFTKGQNSDVLEKMAIEKNWPIVCFTDLDQDCEIISRFSLPKSMKHTVSRGVWENL